MVILWVVGHGAGKNSIDADRPKPSRETTFCAPTLWEGNSKLEMGSRTTRQRVDIKNKLRLFTAHTHFHSAVHQHLLCDLKD
jgi:hypothetical protein